MELEEATIQTDAPQNKGVLALYTLEPRFHPPIKGGLQNLDPVRLGHNSPRTAS